MRPLEAIYNGYRFRSLLKAKWAVFFDTLGVPYEYEREGYRAGQLWYCPDFWLPQQDCWVEVREQAPDEQDEERAGVLVRETGKDVYFFAEIPLPDPADLSAHSGDGAHMYSWGDEKVVCDHRYWWCECPVCGSVGVCFAGWTERLSCGHIHVKTPNSASPRLIAAYMSARSASFETGHDLRIPCSMGHWQSKTLQALLATETKEVEEGRRVYVSSRTYGDSRFHLLSKKYDGIQIEQTNIDEKWGSRVHLQTDELPAVLKTLLVWYLEEVQPQEMAVVGIPDDDEGLGDLDEHPF